MSEQRFFLNPYHFVPAEEDIDEAHSLQRSDFEKAKLQHSGHDRYATGESFHSGRLICRLTTKDPIFIGAQRIREATEQEPAVVAPFELDGQPAIPATSLRGLLASIAEAASNSALRVLANTMFSFRKKAKKGDVLPKIGIFIKQGESFELLPLTLSPRDWRNNTDAQKESIIQQSLAALSSGEIKTLLINNVAVERFYELFQERIDSTSNDAKLKELLSPSSLAKDLPRKNRVKRGQKFHLEHGDVVYYGEQNGEVSEIALSQIWRGRVEYRNEQNQLKPAKAHRFFQEINQELAPFNKYREWITPAEWLFGFVEEQEKGKKEGGLAYAGRVRVSFGRLAPMQRGPYYQDRPVTLKILSSPKPPQPALYFKEKEGSGFIAKKDLNPQNHIPQGRKMYLHRHSEEEKIPPWETQTGRENAEQKVTVTPLKSELLFYFHIDFDNLSDWELGLLCFALQPFESFHHKLGMGKPIGLGKVRIEPVGLFSIDRAKRYQERNLFAANRYHAAWVEDSQDMLEQWPDSYEREKREYRAGDLQEGRDWRQFRDMFATDMDEDIKKALELLGDPDKVTLPVHTPQIIGGDDLNLEIETYQWFVENERKKTFLEPLDRNSDKLPTLPRHPPKPPSKG